MKDQKDFCLAQKLTLTNSIQSREKARKPKITPLQTWPIKRHNNPLEILEHIFLDQTTMRRCKRIIRTLPISVLVLNVNELDSLRWSFTGEMWSRPL